jgi:hypothetical protein
MKVKRLVIMGACESTQVTKIVRHNKNSKVKRKVIMELGIIIVISGDHASV